MPEIGVGEGGYFRFARGVCLFAGGAGRRLGGIISGCVAARLMPDMRTFAAFHLAASRRHGAVGQDKSLITFWAENFHSPFIPMSAIGR